MILKSCLVDICPRQEKNLPSFWNKSCSLKQTTGDTNMCIFCFPASTRMLVPLGTGKSILWLGIISAQCNTTAKAADKTGIKKSPSRPALGLLGNTQTFCSFWMTRSFCMWGLKGGAFMLMSAEDKHRQDRHTDILERKEHHYSQKQIRSKTTLWRLHAARFTLLIYHFPF